MILFNYMIQFFIDLINLLIEIKMAKIINDDNKNEDRPLTYIGTNTFTNYEISKLLDFIKFGENICITTLPGAGKSSMNKIFYNQDVLEKFLSQKEIARYFFVGVDMRQNTVGVKDLLSEYFAMKLGVKHPIDAIEMLAGENKIIYFILDNFNTQEKDLNYYLVSLRNSFADNVRFVSLLDVSDYRKVTAQEKSQFSFFFHNPMQIPYFSRKAALIWCENIINILNIGIKKDKIGEIIDICGGVPFLIKNFLRTSRFFSQDIDRTYESNEFRDFVEIFWEKLAVDYRLVIKNLIYKGRLEKKDQDLIYAYKDLVEYNLIKENVKKKLSGKVIGKWIDLLINENTYYINKFEIIDNRLCWHGVDFEEHFSETELDILKGLIERQGNVLTRDEIAKIIWGDNASSEYSSWAIDKSISRLRKKIKKLSIDSSMIKTLRGRGVRFDR